MVKRTVQARFLAALLALALLTGLLPAALAEDALSITLSPKSASLTVGESLQLNATLSPDGSAGTVTWGSSDDSVATVSDGNVSALAQGTATITATATAANGTTVTDQCVITVNAPTPPSPTPVESVSLSSPTLTLKVGGKDTLTATVLPDDAANKAVTWKSIDYSVATVENGTVTAVSTGTTTITVTTEDGSKTASCTVTVEADTPATIPVKGVTLPSTASVAVGATTQLVPTIDPADATDKNVTWKSNNEDIATVDGNGLVSGHKAGTATITVTTKDGGKTTTCTVTVTATTTAVTGVSVSPTSVTLVAKGTYTLTANVQPATATNKKVTWASSNPAIVTVNPATGVLTGVKAGSATVTATTDDGKKTANCSVTVVSGVTISPATLSLGEGSTSTLSVGNKPNDYVVSWSSSNKNYATVDGNGRVTGVRLGSATITATCTKSGATTYTATCTVTVTSSAAANIPYSTAERTALTFHEDDFYRVCSNKMGRGLSHIIFSSLPASSKGALYYNYSSDGNYDRAISTGASYYYNKSYYISSISFVPAGSFTGTVTIPYTGYDTNGGSFSGNVVITVGAGAEVTYTTGRDSALALDNSMFETYSKNQTGSTFNYVKFTPPTSSKGYLYFNYSSNGDYDSKVSSSTAYYRSSSPRLDNLTFVPADGYTGTVAIPFSGVSTGGGSFSGTLSISVGKGGGTISYTTALNTVLTLDEQDFIDLSKEETDYTLDYVTFTIPSSSKGILYSNYTSSGKGTKLTSSTKLYRSSSPYLEDVSFVPATGFTGTVSIPFTGRNSNGNSFTGTLRIHVGAGSGDITYTTRTVTPVTFDVSNFNSFCVSETKSNLDYVQFTLPSSSKGTLYYNYKSSSSTGNKVSASTQYSRSGTPALDKVTYVPASGVSGVVYIDFTGRSTSGKTISGTIAVKVESIIPASNILYHSDGKPITLRAGDFTTVCNARGGGAFSKAVFTLPDPGYGKLYYNYTGPNVHDGLVTASTAYLATGTPSLSQITFVPKADFRGVVNLNYTGTDLDGLTYSGVVQIAVTPASVSSHFTDMGSYGWSATSVDYLYDAGIVKGTSGNQFGPSLQITRGDFVLMLYRAFRMKDAAAGSGFPDVPADSYYAAAIAAAKNLGIAKGTDGKFNPTASLTREDAMVLLLRTIQVSGTMSDGDPSLLTGYPDGGKVADYAKNAVAALAREGVIQGDSARNLNPKSPITRAEMAAILHRVLTL